ncbi:CLIP-associating protein [Stomoxys calcitrans]|uniref:TOG domain-containing protein n=1 Tax=Stomoxys calcitrans TaxID=35570 RepID=A0A1I8NUP1_STOCA|nr:CLIP-associating protein [Stomoxys calcitrans]
MAYRRPNDLDGFIQLMPKADMRVKGQLAEDLVTFLCDDTNSIVCMDMGLLVDGLMPWLTGSHFKIAQKSLEAFTELIKRLGPDFNAYTSTVLPHVIDRLGDSKDTVREKAQLLLQTLMEHKVLSPQVLLDKLAASCFKHKNAKVREEFLQTIVNTLSVYGTSQLSVRNYIQSICILLGDPTVSVRDSAIQTLVEIYKHVGDRLRPDLRRRDDLPASKLAILEQKFDQIKSEGLLLKSALQQQAHTNNNGHDEADNIAARERPTKIVKRAIPSTSRSKNNIAAESAADAGAVTMEIFEASFEAVPHLNVFHPKDMDDIYRNILAITGDKNADWDKRVDALKKIRSLLLLNIQGQPQFVTVQLKELSISFLDILKEELRSQVIREACITIAFMSKTLHQKLDKFCEYIMEQLILLIQNSAKVIASASALAVKYIIKYTHAPKLLKIISDMLQTSKSKDIRAALCEIVCLLCEEWPTKAIERSAPLLRDTLKKSISDADSEARRHSRRAYWVFRRHFPELADQIYCTLDIAAQKALERERDGGGLGGGNGVEERRATVSTARIQRSPGSIQKPAPGMRSVSAVDTAAANRAKARAQYAFLARKKAANATTANATSGSSVTGSLPRQRLGAAIQQQSTQQASSNSSVSPRVRGRAGVSQSQPGSRSTSPSSKLRDQHGISSYYRPTGTIPKKASGIPRSLASSRETSPTRVANSGGALMKRSLYTTANSRRTPDRNQPTRQLAAARLLQQSRDAENALADALSPEGSGGEYVSMGDYGRDRGGAYSAGARLSRKLMNRDESDDSEASSVCSERSFDSSYTRGNNSNYSLSGSRNRLDWSYLRPPFEDIDTIIQYCASTHWSERKDGLISLTHYLADGKELTPQQLQLVLDTFRKMFMDTHTKVYSLFLETVTELILAYANDLHDWLFILLTRLFNKLGTELLNSMHGKIWKTLQVVHEYFPTDLQMKDVFRILSDSAQTPCTKTRIAILKFLTSLANTYCKNTDFPGSEDGTVLPIVEKALLKIVQMAGDQKSLELRNQARHCLIALYNLNTPQMTRVLSTLPKGYQDSAKVCIQTHLRRSSTSGTNSPSSSPLSSSSPKPLQSPNVSGPFSSLQPQFTSPRSRQSSVTDNDLLGYSEVDVQQNIQKTTEEIRNCFGGFDTQYNSLANNSNGGGYNGHLSEAVDSCASSNSKTQSATTTESNTPESTTMRLDGNLLEQHQKMSSSALGSALAQTNSSSIVEFKFADNGEMILQNGTHESEVIKQALGLTPDMPVPQVQSSLVNLGLCIKGGNCELPNKHFRAIMKMLLNMLDASTNEVVVEALHVLSKILRRVQMKPNWINFVELILLKIINCYPKSKETMRELDMIIPRIVPALPLNLTINIVNPVIATGSYPVNLCALKLLTELADRHGSELTETQLEMVFPHLARLADDYQSMVRKAAVFCIVKLYIVMGEDKVKPKLTMLNPSKVRLLNVYIEKQRGGGSSTKNSSASSS